MIYELIIKHGLDQEIDNCRREQSIVDMNFCAVQLTNRKNQKRCKVLEKDFTPPPVSGIVI